MVVYNCVRALEKGILDRLYIICLESAVIITQDLSLFFFLYYLLSLFISSLPTDLIWIRPYMAVVVFHGEIGYVFVLEPLYVTFCLDAKKMTSC